MSNSVQITFDWREASADLSESQQESLTLTLMKELRQVDEVQSVARVADTDVPQGGMGVGGWLVGLLTAEIPGDGIKAAMKVAAEEVFARVPGKPVNVRVKIGDREVDLGSVRLKDIDEATEKALALAQKLKDIE